MTKIKCVHTIVADAIIVIENGGNMKRLLSYMKKYRAATALAVFCIVLETFLELIIPLIMADMVDVGIANGDKAYIFEKGFLMAACAVVSICLLYTSDAADD